MSEKVQNRNRAVLEAALVLAELRGYKSITRIDVAASAGVACGSVNNAFGTMDALRDAVVATAVERRMLPIIAQALVDRHPAALAAPPEVKDSALASLAA